MVKFRESQTAKNLHNSFAAETQARTRYNFFANKAREEGFIQIAKIFDEKQNENEDNWTDSRFNGTLCSQVGI